MKRTILASLNHYSDALLTEVTHTSGMGRNQKYYSTISKCSNDKLLIEVTERERERDKGLC